MFSGGGKTVSTPNCSDVSPGCDIGCCSCYDPPTCTGGACCCTDQYATQFPQGTGVAATWNLPLVFEMGVVASDESWALQNRANASSAPTDYRSGASSVINILRDGRWPWAPEFGGRKWVLRVRDPMAEPENGVLGFG